MVGRLAQEDSIEREPGKEAMKCDRMNSGQ